MPGSKKTETDATIISDEARDWADIRRAMLAIVSSSGARSVARLLLIVAVVGYYGIARFGRLGEAVAIIEILAAFASFGLPKTLLGYLAEIPNSRKGRSALIANALGLTMLASGLVSLGLWLAWPVVFPASTGIPRYVTLAVPLIAISEILLTVTRSYRVIRWDAVAKGIIKPWSFLILALAGYWVTQANNALDLNQALFGSYIGSLVLTGVFAIFGAMTLIGKNVGSWSLPCISAILNLARSSLPTAIVDGCNFGFRRIDIIILSVVAGPAATGVYYLVQQMATVAEKMRHLFEPMVAPIIAQTQSLPLIEQHLKRLSLWIFAVQLGILVVLTLHAREILALLGGEFSAIALLVALIVTGEVFDGTSGLADLPLIFRFPRLPSQIVIATIVIELATISLLAGFYGAIGAAAGFALAMLAQAGMRLFWLHRKLGLTLLGGRFLRPLAATVATAAVIASIHTRFVVNGLPQLIASVIFTLVVYALLLRVFGISLQLRAASN